MREFDTESLVNKQTGDTGIIEEAFIGFLD